MNTCGRLSLLTLLFFGASCSDETASIGTPEAPEVADSALQAATPPPNEEPQQYRPEVPDNISQLAPNDLEFTAVPDGVWSASTVVWDRMTREEALAAIGLSSSPRILMQWGDNVRVREVYYGVKMGLKDRWQEELIDGSWISNGPGVYFPDETTCQIEFRRRGTPHGTFYKYDAEGGLRRSKHYVDGVQVSE